MADAISACVHCGYCLPDCPTYQVLGRESDSPRGRIVIMKEVLEGTLDADTAAPHIDRCLGCLSCETSCPSGVRYGELLAPFRDLLTSKRKRSPIAKLRHRLIATTIPSPKYFRTALSLARFARPLRKLLPAPLAAPFDLLPDKLVKAVPLAANNPAQGEQRGHVALLAGCAQQVIAPGINTDTIELLTRHGIAVSIPENQVCCGALAWHIGDAERARTHARKNIEVFPRDLDAIISNAAGCGSGLREYPSMLAGEEEEPLARAFADKSKDITVYLDSLDLPPPPNPGRKIVIAYHDACHLAHAQGVREAPRRLLRSIPGVELVDLPDADICCGSAGTYNLDQPTRCHQSRTAHRLRSRDDRLRKHRLPNSTTIPSAQTRPQGAGAAHRRNSRRRLPRRAVKFFAGSRNIERRYDVLSFNMRTTLSVDGDIA